MTSVSDVNCLAVDTDCLQHLERQSINLQVQSVSSSESDSVSATLRMRGCGVPRRCMKCRGCVRCSSSWPRWVRSTAMPCLGSATS